MISDKEYMISPSKGNYIHTYTYFVKTLFHEHKTKAMK